MHLEGSDTEEEEEIVTTSRQQQQQQRPPPPQKSSQFIDSDDEEEEEVGGKAEQQKGSSAPVVRRPPGRLAGTLGHSGRSVDQPPPDTDSDEEKEEEEEEEPADRSARGAGGSGVEEDVPVESALGGADFGHYTAPHSSSPSRTSLAAAGRRHSDAKRVHFSPDTVDNSAPLPRGGVEARGGERAGGQGGREGEEEWEEDAFGRRVRKFKNGNCCSMQ